jgi:large subunit ribosomal protein L10
MTREEKYQLVEELTERLAATDNFYIMDAAGMTVEQTNEFRRACFQKGLKYQVAKNALIKKALQNIGGDFSAFEGTALKGFSGIVFSPESASEPARMLKDFRKAKKSDKPLLKGASINRDLFIGDNQLEALCTLKSKAELLGEVIGLLQSPARNVISALQSSGQTLSGILKTLEEKNS